jgi:hypothetical protein
MNTPGTGEARRGHLLRRHGVAVFLTSVLLLWGAGFARMEDGSIPTLDRGGVVAALASEAGSSTVAERLRVSAMQGTRRHPGGKRPGPPPIPS